MVSTIRINQKYGTPWDPDLFVCVDPHVKNEDLRPGVAAINTWAVVQWHPVVLVQLLVQLVELRVAVFTSYIPAVEDLCIILVEDLYIILVEDLYIILVE